MSVVTIGNGHCLPDAFCYNEKKLESNSNSENKFYGEKKQAHKFTPKRNTDSLEEVGDNKNCDIISTPRRKRRRHLSSSSEENSDISDCNISPEINYSGTPVTYKLFEVEGRFFIVKRPMSSKTQKTQKCTDHDISCILLDSDSEDLNIFEAAKKSRKKAVKPPESSTADSQSCESSPEYIPSKRKSLKQKEVPLRIKLRRSTEQSNYKIENNSDCEQQIAKSCKTATKVAQQSCGTDSCDEDHSVHKKTLRSRRPVQYCESSVTDEEQLLKQQQEQDSEIRASISKTPSKMDIQKSSSPITPISGRKRRTSQSVTFNVGRLKINNESDKPNKSDVDEIRDAGSQTPLRYRKLLDKEGSETPQKQIKKLQETDTPRSLRTRRQSRSVSYSNNEDGTDSVNNKENKSDVDDEIDSQVIHNLRGLGRRRLSTRRGSETPKKQSRNIEETVTPRTIRTRRSSKTGYSSSEEHQSSNVNDDKKRIKSDNDNDIVEITDYAESRELGRRRLSVKQGSETPQKQIKILEDSMTPKRTPRRGGMKKLEEVATPKRTPRKAIMTSIAEEPKTPTSIANKRILKAVTPSVKTGSLTPSMTRRTANVDKPKTILEEARSRLHVSAVPKSLPCREEEFNDIFTFLERKLLEKSAGCIYISGVPGTGKTATVNEVIRCLKKLVAKGDLENFDFIEINGMKLSEPRQAYVQILKQMNGQTATWEQAHQLLERRFTQSNAKRPMTLLLVDELDLLCNKRQDVVYNLLDWPAKANAHLVVITIANTMDLPERVLMGRVTSRLGLTRLTFQPYNHKQLQEIVIARLKDSDAFKSEAIQLVARKVAAVSGDARRALDICRRATEITEFNSGKIVTMQDVNQALTEMIASAKVQAIKNCSEMEKIFLQAVCAEVTRTGVEEASFENVYKQLEGLCSFEGFKVPNITQALGICGRLGANRLLLCEHSRIDIQQRILLNVSSDDIHFATQTIDI